MRQGSGFDFIEATFKVEGDLRRQISYVPQDVFLFSDTVSGNIQFGLDRADEEKVHLAARYASVDKEIDGFASDHDDSKGMRR